MKNRTKTNNELHFNMEKSDKNKRKKENSRIYFMSCTKEH